MKKSVNISKLLLAGLVCIASSNIYAQELITNGSFESGSFSGFTFSDSSNNTNVGTNAPGSAFNFARQGNSWANLGASPNIGSLMQTINTTPGAMYTFSFSFAVDSTPPEGIRSFQALFDGISVFTATPAQLVGDENGGPYIDISLPVTASGSTAVVEFRYRHDDDFFRLDVVSVVPEPSTVSLLVIAAAGGLFGLYRQSRRAASLPVS